MEEDQNSSSEEVAPQVSESGVVETNQDTEEVQESEGSHEPEDKQERNWKEIRKQKRESEVREKEAIARDKAKGEIIEMLLKERNKVVPLTQEAAQPEEEIPAEDFMNKGQTDKRIDLRSEKKYIQMRQKEDAARWAERLNSEFSDFAEVVNADSIAMLEQKKPKLASTIAKLKDPYDMGYQTYHFLKGMNLGEEVKEKRHAKEVEDKLEKNEKIVQSPQAFDKRPMAQAFRLTDSEKSKLFEEMQEAAGKVGFGY